MNNRNKCKTVEINSDKNGLISTTYLDFQDGCKSEIVFYKYFSGPSYSLTKIEGINLATLYVAQCFSPIKNTPAKFFYTYDEAFNFIKEFLTSLIK